MRAFQSIHISVHASAANAKLLWRCVALISLAFLFLIAVLSMSFAQESSPRQISFQTLEIAASNATIDQVCCDSEFEFSLDIKTSAPTAFGGNPVWLKLDQVELLDLLQVSPILDEVTLYFRNTPEGPWQTVQSGDTVPTGLKSYLSPFLILPIPSILDPSSVYLRIVQRGIPVTIAVNTWKLPAFIAMQSADRTIKMALLGFIGAMIFYNLLVAVIVRDKIFALNALTVLSLLLIAFYLSGYGVAFLWPDMPERSNVFFFVGIAGGVTFGSIFLGMFIKKQEAPIQESWPFIIPPIFALLALTSLLFVPEQFVQLFLILSGLLTFVIAVPILLSKAIKGNREARILLFPMSFALVPGLMFVALDKYLGVTVIDLGNNGMEITLGLEAIFFSLALASRIRIAESKNQKTSDRLLALRGQTAAKIISAQDKERQRLSKELHDGVGQNLLVVLGNLKRLATSEPDNSRREEISTQAQTATNILNDLRRISRDMHPMTLEHLGLEKSIAGLLEGVQKSSAISTSLHSNYLEGSVDPQTRLHLFRIIQECLANIMRHAKASSCIVSLQQIDGNISLIVQDNGKGIETSSPDTNVRKGLGFISIDDRVRAIGAKWSCKNLENGGLRIKITLKNFPPYRTMLF